VSDMVHRGAGSSNDNAKFRVSRLLGVSYVDPAQRVIRELIGRDLSNTEMAAVVGAPEGSLLRVEARGNRIFTSTVHPKIDRQYRFIERDDKGRLYLYNDEFFKKDPAKDAKLGLTSFITQVLAARSLGAKYIEAFLDGSWQTRNKVNGYYVWALYGYDVALYDHEIASLPSRFKGVRTLNELILAEGDDWWYRKGTGREAVFDLSDGSTSLMVLALRAAYKGYNVVF